MNAIKLICTIALATPLLAACATTGYQAPRDRSVADIQYEYGLRAGEPMRDSPKP
jgi:hypothetical protein